MLSTAIDSLSRRLYHQASGLFLLRLATGAIFIAHGAMKVGNIAATSQMFAHMGLMPSMEWAWFIGLLELVGGAALIFGIATRFFGAALGIEMLVAICLTGIDKGLMAHQLELILGAASLAIALAGSGSWSLYPMECATCRGFLCEGDTCAPL